METWGAADPRALRHSERLGRWCRDPALLKLSSTVKTVQAPERPRYRCTCSEAEAADVGTVAGGAWGAGDEQAGPTLDGCLTATAEEPSGQSSSCGGTKRATKEQTTYSACDPTERAEEPHEGTLTFPALMAAFKSTGGAG